MRGVCGCWSCVLRERSMAERDILIWLRRLIWLWLKKERWQDNLSTAVWALDHMIVPTNNALYCWHLLISPFLLSLQFVRPKAKGLACAGPSTIAPSHPENTTSMRRE